MQKVLDKGFIRLVDFMGDDNAIVQSARVSYGNGTKTHREDSKLIDYLMKNRHTSPFEMVEFKFHVKLPIFVARQWMRHRTGSFNEISGRYSVLKDEYYVPSEENICLQNTENKQGRGQIIDGFNSLVIRTAFHEICDESFKLYNRMIEDGIAREIARMILPLNTYTEFYWKTDLHNLLNFLRLRLDEHAQFEIREYAKAISILIHDHVPSSLESFQKYIFGGNNDSN